MDPSGLPDHIQERESEAVEHHDGTQPSTASSSSARLPGILRHASTARETDNAKHERLHNLGGGPVYGSDAVVDRIRIRYAPEAVEAPTLSRQEIHFPSLSSSNKREADSEEKIRVLQAMEADLNVKQNATARYFSVLHDLQQKSTSGSMKALLQQIFNLLFRATYLVNSATGVGLTRPEESNNNTVEFDPNHVEELAGHEYFSLYTHAQQTLEVVSLKKQQLDTKLNMERSLEHELGAVLHQLDQDLHVIRTQHLENHELVEAERTAVQQLEEEYAALTSQELDLLKECDGLSLQADRQHNQLTELQNKSAYLDFISRIPLKKHLEQKKIKEQEDALLAVVLKEEAENQQLEDELAKLNQQIEGLEEQYVKDVANRALLETQLVDAEQLRDATQIDYLRVRDCHTPRPSWDAIIEKIPELSSNDDVEWDEMQAAMGTSPAFMMRRAEAAAKTDSPSKHNIHEEQDGDDNDDGDGEEDDVETGGQTQELVKEILQWIERLQKHCGVNLHLSRIWHDVEEARVELNILQHQLERALRKHTRYPFGGGARGLKTPDNGISAKQRAKPEYICALGIHDEIPLFLRHQGKVKRHPLKKSELEALIRKVWTEKRQREKRNPHLRLPLEEVLYEKLYRKYGFQPLIAEWGYNILISLDKFAWDAEIELFLLCLTNAISDQVFTDQEQMLDKCVSLLLKLSESYHNDSFLLERRVLLKDALVALRKFFPLKTSIQLQALEKAMIRDMHKMKRGGNDSILYIDDVLPIGVGYPRGFFVKALRSQHFKEIQDYYVSLNAELESRDGHKTGELPLFQVQDAMLGVDPLADQNTVCAALMRALGVKTRAQLEMHEIVPYKAILRKMNTTGLLKFALNYDPTAETHWQHRGTIDLSLLTGGTKPRNSGSARKSIMLAKSQSSSRDQQPN